jgi:hypothetical protein
MVPTGGRFAWFVAGAEKMRLDTNGNVGIGTTSPTGSLDIAANAAGSTDNLLTLRNLGGAAFDSSQINFATGTAGANDTRSAIAGYVRAGGKGNLIFKTWNGTSLVEQVRIDENGRLGIGSDNPAAKLEVQGTEGVILNAGNVGIGTTSPSQKLSVTGTIASTSGGFKFLDGSTLSSATKMVGSGGGAASIPTSGCPTGYILVPGDTDYGTSDFCVMKYEAKFGDKGAEPRAAGVLARGLISQTISQASCRNLGPGYALMNNAEWMTIAANVANVV